MGQELSRRNFIGGALLAGMGLAGAGVLTACSGNGGEAKSEAADTSGITWDKEADVVVLGSGAGGMWGAIVAQENGLTPIVLEKQPEATAGGDLRVSGGYLLPVSTDPELMVGSASFGQASEEWADAVDELGIEAIDWVIDHGCEWANGVEYMQVEGAGVAIYECLRDNMADMGIEVLYETPAVKLITNAEGEVIGVAGESAGQVVNVKAKKGVLVATGSYTMNKEFMSNFHIPGIEYYPTGSPYLTGDGLIMAGNLGAKMSRLAMGVEYNGFCSKAASEEIGLAVCSNIAPGAIIVNQDGNRFMNEQVSIQHSKSTMPFFKFQGTMMECRNDECGYVNSKMFEIFDQATFDSFNLGNTALSMTWANIFEDVDNGYVWSEDNQAELDAGFIVKADTLDALAGEIGVDAANLKASVESCNAACASGEDSFGRPADTMVAIGAGPYYAMELAVAALYSMGGLTTNDQGQTINWSNEPIPRLYSAGNVGMVGPYLEPTAINGAWGQAALAIDHIASLDDWDAAKAE